VRIVVPIHSFEPGGVERVALRLAANWQADGAEVTVVLGREEGAGRITEAAGLTYRGYRSWVRTGAFETLWMIICLYRYLNRERADVLFCPGNTYTVVAAAMRLLLGRRCPPTVAKISNDLRRTDLPAPARLAYRLWTRAHGLFIDRFVALAEPMAPEIVEETGVDRGRVSVIPDPALTEAEFASLAAIERRPCPRDGALLLGVGRLVGQKNFALLLRAFAAHAPGQDRLLIAGEGPERPRLERLAATLGIASRVTFAGHCDDVPALLREADVFVLSSAYEGVPAAIVEALSAGMPIVATDCSGSIGWLTGFGRDGVVVPPGNVEALGRALRNIRDLPPPTAEGRLRAARFTLERGAGSYLAVFALALEALRSGGGRASAASSPSPAKAGLKPPVTPAP
jgi:glycosyltransferase involved in cell wall biosynthesis